MSDGKRSGAVQRFGREVAVGLVVELIIAAGTYLIGVWNWSGFDARADQVWEPRSLAGHIGWVVFLSLSFPPTAGGAFWVVRAAPDMVMPLPGSRDPWWETLGWVVLVLFMAFVTIGMSVFVIYEFVVLF